MHVYLTNFQTGFFENTDLYEQILFYIFDLFLREEPSFQLYHDFEILRILNKLFTLISYTHVWIYFLQIQQFFMTYRPG